MTEPISRRALVVGGSRRAATVALAIGSLGAVGCGGEPARSALVPTPPGALDDDAIARILASAELLAIDFYGHALTSIAFAGAQAEYLRAARANEESHLLAIRVLRPDVPHRLRFDYPEGTFASRASVVSTGVVLEQAFLGAYLGAVSEASDPAMRTLAARIAANEAQHLQALTSLDLSAPGAADSLPSVLTAQEAARIVAPFLA